MRSRRLFLAAALFLVAGFATLWSKWNGSAGINAGYPMDQWVVSFNGSVHGWPAMIGMVCLLAGLILLVIALIRAVME